MGDTSFDPSPFGYAVRLFGRKRAIEVADNVIFECIERNAAIIQTMIMGAATNDQIGLDGLYFLLRSDPSLWMSD